VWSDVPDIEGLQVSISDIIEMLERFDTPTTVVTRMFRTPSDQMYVFTRAETDALGINRLGAVVLGDAGYMRSLAGELQSQPALRTQAGSAVQSPDYASNWRLALYGGMDFYGQDINMSRQVDSVACAIACMDEPICVAFTFNANPRISTGPNCFLKEGTSRLEIYRDALSGLFIPPDVREPPIFQVDGEVFSPLEVIDLGD